MQEQQDERCRGWIGLTLCSVTPIKNNDSLHSHSLYKHKNQLWPTAGSSCRNAHKWTCQPSSVRYLALICILEGDFIWGHHGNFPKTTKEETDINHTGSVMWIAHLCKCYVWSNWNMRVNFLLIDCCTEKSILCCHLKLNLVKLMTVKVRAFFEII